MDENEEDAKTFELPAVSAELPQLLARMDSARPVPDVVPVPEETSVTVDLPQLLARMDSARPVPQVVPAMPEETSVTVDLPQLLAARMGSTPQVLPQAVPALTQEASIMVAAAGRQDFKAILAEGVVDGQKGVQRAGLYVERGDASRAVELHPIVPKLADDFRDKRGQPRLPFTQFVDQQTADFFDSQARFSLLKP